MMSKHESESSQHELQNEKSEGSIVTVPAGTPIFRSAEDLERLRRLAARPDSEIDFSDIPRLTPEEYEAAKRSITEQRSKKLQKAS
jgi:hypothetical protein